MYNDPTYETFETKYNGYLESIELDSLYVGLVLQHKNDGIFQIIDIVEGNQTTTQIATIQLKNGTIKEVNDNYLNQCYTL